MIKFKLSESDIDIDWLYQQKELSSRGSKACFKAGIKTILDLKKFHNKHSSFNSIHGCGKKTNRELIKLCKRSFEAYNSNSIHEIQLPLTERQFEYEVEQLFKKNLGIRAKNALLEYLGDSFVIDNIEKRIVFTSLEDIKLNNVGKKTSEEIHEYIQKVIELYHVLKTLNE